MVQRYKLHTDDLLKRMGFTREQSPLTEKQLREGLIKLDPCLNNIKASKLSKEIMEENKKIEVQKLLAVYNPIEEEDKHYDKIWFKNMLWKLHERQEYLDQLRASFEIFDMR